MRLSIVAVAVLLVSPAALAEPWGFGARVGGYGFRDAETSQWDDCRMNGLGVFAERKLGEHAFVEGGLDLYSATGDAIMTESMDRVSSLATVAAGLRMFPRAIVSPFVQVGVGGEYTHVSVASSGFDNTYFLPVGFFGAGGDLHLGDHMRLGMTIRVLMMGGFSSGAPGQDPQLSAQPAAQVQFFARYDL